VTVAARYGPYAATLRRMIDGDTFVLLVDVGFEAFVAVKVRALGIDAPEVHGATRPRGLMALNFAGDLLAGRELHVISRARSFERWVCEVFVTGPDGVQVPFADAMIAAGHAVPMGE
jgi:endonuclease YncB( thermonuclease family)